MARPFAADYDPIRHGEFFVDYCRNGMERALRSRERIPADQLMDIRMDDLGRHPVATLKQVYDRFGLSWHPDMPARTVSHLRERALHRKALRRGHSYTAEQFGLTAAGLSRTFADYENRFLGA